MTAQGSGDFANGNWNSGINFLDKAKVGPRENMPDFMKNDKSRNTYYFLPLLLGLLGLFYQYNKEKKGFTITMLLFVFTGIAIVVYLNQYPLQPRERDYAYAGSFYAFAIWIGLGVVALYSFVRKFLKGKAGAVAVTVVSFVLVPGVLGSQNWDDHDRSNRYMTRDFAINYLESCAPNAILLTYGDNDTFPLWYVQEVEGVRPDIKIVNMSYLGMDWYISQQQKKTYDAAPIPFSFTKDKYYMGRLDAVLFQERFQESVELSEAMDFLGSDDVRTKVRVTSGDMIDFLPARKFHITVDKQKVLETGTVKPEDADLIVDKVEFEIKKSYITKSEMAVLNMIAANNWERPIYIDHSLLFTGNIFFTDYLQYEGLAYRFVPIKTGGSGVNMGRIDADILYDHVMNKFVWGNVNSPDVYLDDYNKKALNIIQARYLFARLAQALLQKNENEKAVEVLDKMFDLFPNERIPLSYDSNPAIEMYYMAGEIEKGNKYARIVAENSLQKLSYYIQLPERFAAAVQEEQTREMAAVQNILMIADRYDQEELKNEVDGKLKELIAFLENKNNS